MNLTDAQALIERAMKRDQHALARRLQSAKADTAPRIIEEIKRSVAVRQARADRLPRPTYPLELPVVEKRAELLEAIDRNQVVIICGETGSGKTTQLPKLCLELGRGVAGYIGHTQPRRIAARSVAQRIADELESPLGQTVGYKIRFSDRVSDQTYIKLMTDGILLAESQHDRFLDAYDTIIIDEAHERSLNIDFLLGYLHRLLPRRPDLKLIITSATIDPERFSRHFNDAPIVMVSGRTYPVDVRYRPLQSDDPDEEDAQLMDRIIAGVDEVCREGLGDVLVFLPGEREIRTVAEALRKHHPPGTEILPLYARLSNEEQNRVFHPHGRRRIVLATNVAETSLTVPGIRYVVDPGDARISRYAPRTKVQRLPIEPVSQASANQRMGRCGRVSAGICVRLYSEEDFLSRPVFTDPEILRTNLASVILQMKALGLGQIEQFPFIDPPDTRQIRDGYQTLHEIGAIDDKDNLTPLGKKLALLPIDPRIGRMVFAGIEQNVVEEILIIAAALSVQDPRERPLDKQEQADQQHARFRDEQSDFLTYLNLWYFFEEQSAHLSQSKLRKLCRESFLSYVRMREWHDIHQQLRGQLLERHITPAKRNDKADPQDSDRFKRVYPAGQYDAIHRALLSGLLGNIGHRGDGVEYSGARNIKFHLFPGSTLFKAKPLWMMAAELVETTRLYARSCARIQPDWLERVAAHLIHRAYSDPQWNENQQHATINEKVTLYGLPIVAKRTIAMGPVDPAEARRLFIHHALVEPTLRGNPQFLQHNRALVDEIEQLEARTRKRDLLVDMQVRFDFYDARIPPGIYNPQLFQGWRNKAERENPKLLHMKRDDLMRYTPSELDTTAFPDHLLINGIRLPLEYHLEAGHALDGVTVDIPLAALTQLPDEPFDWLVPGLLVDKLVVLIRSLPKSLRTQFVPAPDVAAECAAKLQFAHGNLIEQFARCLGKLRGQNVEPNDFAKADLPVHLRMNYRIRDDRGKELAVSRDLRELRTRFRSQAQSTFMQAPPAEFNRDNIVRWDVGDLPERIEIRQKHSTLNGYPALVDGNTSVSLRLLDSRESADRALRVAVRRLFMLQNAKEFSDVWRSLRDSTQLALFYKTLGNADQLRTHLLTAVADLSLYGDHPRAVRTELDYMTLVELAWRNLYPTADRVSGYARDALKLYHQLSLALGKAHTPMAADSIKDMRAQLTKLMPADFLIATPNASLPHLPRYLEGINRRLTKLANAGLARDRQQLAVIAPLEKMLAERTTAHQKAGIEDPALAQYRWMLEELRVSLFAQELKTPVPISPKRLEEQWKRVQIVR